MRRWLTDPLLLFLLIGAAIFAAEVWLGGDDDYTIVVAPAAVDRLGDLWEAQTGRAPTADELGKLVEDHVREEIMVREAKRLGLDEGDTIIRRRLAQKLSFLTDDVATLATPDEAELRAHFEANPKRYETPAVTSFSHVFFSADRRDDAAGDARAALADFDPDGWRKAGDPFMLGRTYAWSSEPRIERDFGTAFATALAEIPADGLWRGPIESGYGAHLVRVDARNAALGADYESVAARVAADFDAERRAEANRAYFAALRAQYAVVLP